MPEAPPHVHKRILLESEAVDDNEATATKLEKIFGIKNDDAREMVLSLE